MRLFILKYSLLALFSFSAFHSCISFAQNVPVTSDADCAGITLSYDTINLGSVMHNSVTMRTVTITNSGKCPLVISSIDAPYPHEYVCDKTFLQPGDSGYLSLYYTADNVGTVMHTLSIYSNAGVKPKLLIIKGTVLAENRCAVMTFDHDTLDCGSIPYVIGRHFFVNVRNTGTCNLTFAVQPNRDQYLNILDHTRDSIGPGDTGKIGIHIGGQLTGNFYGELSVTSSNANPGNKTLFLKGRFAQPAATDTNDSKIELSQDFFDFKTVRYKGTKAVRSMAGEVEITNTGKKALVVIQNDPFLMVENTPQTPKRILPGATAKMSIHFYYTGAFPAMGEVLVHTLISGNFRGKNIPVYARWKYEKQ